VKKVANVRENTSVSPRKNYPKNRRPKTSVDEEPRGVPSTQSFEEDDQGLWIVRKLTGSAANKPYRCPGCDQLIPMATPHTVAWLEGDEDGRRHWHHTCWSKRNNRRPNTERTRNAPRY
jgi:hypothetical protein